MKVAGELRQKKMKKMSTFFKKDPNDLGRVVSEINPENRWVLNCGLPTRKFDGTACMIKDFQLYKRYDVKKNKKTGKFKKVPDGAISCQEPDMKSGHWPHWILCDRNNSQDKYHFEAFDNLECKQNGTYELCGEKVQGNPEKIKGHKLILHGSEYLNISDFSFEGLKNFLSSSKNNIEGIVFYSTDGSGRMCKIRKVDFGIKRYEKERCYGK